MIAGFFVKSLTLKRFMGMRSIKDEYDIYIIYGYSYSIYIIYTRQAYIIYKI